MNKIKSFILKSLMVSIVAFTMSGCSTMMESVQSQMEVPTLENQANRVAIGMAIVRENNIMAFKMPISSDAYWPTLVAADINESEDRFIMNSLRNDPYYATVHYSDFIQRKRLGSSASMNMLGDFSNITSTVLNQSVKPLTKRAIQKIIILYGKNQSNWPNIYDFGSSLDNFIEFRDGNLKDIEAPKGDVYETIGEAVISLAPINMQKDLNVARINMLDEFEEVAAYKSQKAELQKVDDSKRVQEKLQTQREIAMIDTKIAEAESLANEKEIIYFQLLDQALIALESDINIDDENYVKLAKNINIVSSEIQVGATQAYASFGLAAANIASNDILRHFPYELESLAIAKARIPYRLQSKYDQRVARLIKNAVYLLPNILVGTYYASKQVSLAQKYENVTNIILLAHKIKTEQDSAVAEPVSQAK